MSLADMLANTAAPSFKFDTIGATVTGTVKNAQVIQKRNFDTGQPEFWSDGKPVEQIRILLDTALRDPADPEDDGTRAIYIKGWGDQLRALQSAIRAAGATDVLPGGTFTATYTGDGQVKQGQRGFPPKVYQYAYRAPSATAGILGGQQPAPAPAYGQQQPAYGQPTPQPAPTSMTPEQQAAFAAYQATQQG